MPDTNPSITHGNHCACRVWRSDMRITTHINSWCAVSRSIRH